MYTRKSKYAHLLKDVPVHPVANMFPLHHDEVIERMAKSIKDFGQQQRCAMYEKQLVDGRNRWIACKLAKVKPRRYTLTKRDINGSLVRWVMEQNAYDRELNKNEKGILAGQYKLMLDQEDHEKQAAKRGKKNGGKIAPDQKHRKNRDLAAESFGVSGRYADYGATVLSKGCKALIQACKEKRIALEMAAKLANSASKAEQERLMKAGPNSIRMHVSKHEAAKQNGALTGQTEFKDDRRQEVPKPLVPVWQQKQKIVEQCKSIKTVTSELKKINKRLNLETLDHVIVDLEQAQLTVSLAQPQRLDDEFDWLTKGDVLG